MFPSYSAFPFRSDNLYKLRCGGITPQKRNYNELLHGISIQQPLPDLLKQSTTVILYTVTAPPNT